MSIGSGLMSIDDDSTTRWANAATTPEIHHPNAREEDDNDNNNNSRPQHHGYAVGRRSRIGEELEILQTSMRSLRRKQFSRDRKQALNKVQFDGEGRPAIELQQSKEKTSAKRPLGNGNQPQKQDEGPAQISRSYSTIRLVKQSSTKSGTRPNGSPVLPFKDPASQFWGSPNKGKHAVSAAHRSMTTRPLPPIPRPAIEPYQGTRRVPGSHDFDFHMAEEREHHEKQDNSNDEWTKEESAIFEMLDNLDSSFSATSRADESMGDSSFGELSFANGYKEFLGGENTGRGDADRANSFSGVFADNIPAIERKTSRRRSSRDVSIQLDGVQRSLAKRSVASRGSIRRKAAQEDLRKAMRGQVARSSLNEAPHASEGDWEMVERSMAQSHGELKDGNLRMFGIRSGFRTLGKERAKAGRKET
ncbi:hypothetical protein BKA70DRAFT_1413768 [Coprinopsis sp. MPI-PUGE-AT-0042]|nr:hypothetical protein BKA70DRAFT_1413768 [Coprinopsis sp. MPI-PUGE-AT-0042]